MIKKRKKLNRIFKEKFLDNIIHQSSDQYGTIQVLDDGLTRSLHFDSIEKQSCFDPKRPEFLVLSYTRSMMAGFLMNPKATRFLNIGLGGGSIPRFLLHNVEDCRIDTVELRKSVVDIAGEYFLLPNDDRLKVIVEDAYEFVMNNRFQRYDMIFVDAFEHNGIADAVVNELFFKNCQSLLNPNGVFCINFWSEPKDICKKIRKRLNAAFSSHLLEIPVEDRTNRIGFGLFPADSTYSLMTLKKRSRILQNKFALDFPEFLKDMLKYNDAYFKQIDVIK
ncbi:fused MFS/spermidine synthase [bacterium]|nr:fused MFS/spermidine synthase [bacterium]